ncbi:MAG: substrate-binding domain-containing protein [Blautia marasmi]
MKALQESGYRVPQDVSIIGFDDLPFCEIAVPRLTRPAGAQAGDGKAGSAPYRGDDAGEK